jgi:uridine kinase
MASLTDVVARVLEKRSTIPARQALLVAVSGIDGSGKGYVTGRIAAQLQAQGLRIATINVDGWLHLPDRVGAPKLAS